MNDLFDAYSVHIYWDYWDTPFFKEKRLKDIRKIVTEELPASARKPTYVMEFGVRGKSFPGKPNVESGYWDDGTDIARTNVAGVPAALVRSCGGSARLHGLGQVGRLLGPVPRHVQLARTP